MLLIEKTTLAWWVITTLAVIVLWHPLADPVAMMHTHMLIACCMTASWAVGSRLMHLSTDNNGRWVRIARATGLFVRIATPLAMLTFWYGETYSFCSLLPYKDHLFAQADQWLTGGQPSIEFSRAVAAGALGLSEKVWSELFNMGYWSYYLMQAVVVLYYFLFHRQEASRAAAVILASFFLFYTIYFILPVAGPQFYFAAIGVDAALDGSFADVGRYFATHTDMLPAPGWSDGLFYHLVADAQSAGEFPTAAFPSSHIGCTVVFLCLAWRRSTALFCLLLPFALLLACATVYIQAHYLVDALAGLIAGVIVYRLISPLMLKKSHPTT